MSELDPLFYWRGISPDYINFKGEHVTVPLENKKKLLEAMSVDLSSSAAIAKEVFKLDVEPWLNWLEPFLLCRADDPAFAVNLAPEDVTLEFKWMIQDHAGDRVDAGEFSGDQKPEIGNYIHEGVKYTKKRIQFGLKKPGYYTLTLSAGDKVVESKLAIAPTTAFNPSWAEEGQKIWGFILHLYTLRTENDWGIGDFSDLYHLIERTAAKGGGVIGLNPLHTLSPYLEDSFSPYSPSDRRFISPLYIDVEEVPYFIDSMLSAEQRAKIDQLRQLDQVKYHDVAALKYLTLRKIFREFVLQELKKDSDLAHSLCRYIEGVGQPIVDYAKYELAHQPYLEESKRQKALDSIENASFEAILEMFKRAKSLEVLFYCYVQWIANQQLERCQRQAETLGMEIGVVKDLAVGADGGGAEVSSNADLFRRSASVGAPPDPMALTGQNWGIPPMDPAMLKTSCFEHYIALLKANMSRCGALRIDHAMSLMRLWWCPPGQNADAGAYVYYPFEQMLGLLCLESELNHCVIIGEDLGVVPNEFRDAIGNAKIFSNKVFYFEKDHNGRFKCPQDYAEHALAMVNNHDVPTLTSWWNGTDLKLRDDLGLLEEGTTLTQVLAGREFEKQCLFDLLHEFQVLPETWYGADVSRVVDEDLIAAILLLASKSRSQIFVLQLEDLMMMDAPVNVPGTFREYPNWQRKLSQTIESLFDDPRVDALLDKINSERKLTSK